VGWDLKRGNPALSNNGGGGGEKKIKVTPNAFKQKSQKMRLLPQVNLLKLV